MMDNSRIVHRRYLMAYGTALISAFFILTLNVELLTSQESTASSDGDGSTDDHDCVEQSSASSVIEAGRIITVSHPCESTPGTENPDEDTDPPEPEDPEDQEPEDPEDHECDPSSASSVIEAGRIITVSHPCGNGEGSNPGPRGTDEETDPPEPEEPDRGEETEPDQEPSVPEEESNPSVPEEESNPSDVQSEDSQTIDESTLGATQSGVIHRNATDGFQIQVPAGWVVEDIDNTNISTQMNEQQSGYTYLARICPLDNALIVSVGRYQCEQGSTANVNVMRFNDLHQRPEFASLGNRDISTSDFLSYYVQFWQISDVQILNNTDTAINVINAQTNQIVATMPAKLVEYTYLYSPDGTTMTQGREFTLLVLNGGIGYSLFYEGLASSLTSGTPPFQVDQVFDSFRLLTATPGG
jgi:hypothetical protein